MYRYVIFKFELMSFGLMNLQSTFQKMTDVLSGGLPFVKVHLCDVVVFLEKMIEHMEHFKQVY